MTDDLSTKLWNEHADAADYSTAHEGYYSIILEQYKLYVEMADRVSARRAIANTYFLSLNTSVVAAVGLLWSTTLSNTFRWWLVIPFMALVVQCFAWFYIVRSYRQLNSAKYRVVGALEERLPASPYWKAEWSALGEGRERSRYWPLTHLEQWLPITFGVIYLALSLVSLLS